MSSSPGFKACFPTSAAYPKKIVNRRTSAHWGNATCSSIPSMGRASSWPDEMNTPWNLAIIAEGRPLE